MVSKHGVCAGTFHQKLHITVAISPGNQLLLFNRNAAARLIFNQPKRACDAASKQTSTPPESNSNHLCQRTEQTPGPLPLT